MLTAHILRQAGHRPAPLLDWVLHQADRYGQAFQARWTQEQCDHAACQDLLIWQREGRLRSTTRWGVATEILDLLEGLEEAATNLKEIKP